MQTTQQLTITLPEEMVNVVKAKVREGEYASESDMILDALRALQERNRAVDSWLVNKVGPAYDSLRADPTKAVHIENLRKLLAAQHNRAKA